MKSLEDYLKDSSDFSINLDRNRNFSNEEVETGPVLVTFSCNEASLISAEPYINKDGGENKNINFSQLKATTEDVMECFSVGFLQFYMEETRPARDSLKRRIQQVVNFIKSKDKEFLLKPSVKSAMRKYIYIFILQKIQDYISLLAKSHKEDDKKNANLIIALGIGPYLSDRKAIGHLQMTLKMLAPQLKKDGTMQKPLQLKVKQAFSSVFTDILKTIEKKFIPEDKQGVLTSKGSNLSQKKEPNK